MVGARSGGEGWVDHSMKAEAAKLGVHIGKQGQDLENSFGGIHGPQQWSPPGPSEALSHIR